MSLEISYEGNVCSFYTYEIVAKTNTRALRFCGQNVHFIKASVPYMESLACVTKSAIG